jgi:hypothetical protein
MLKLLSLKKPAKWFFLDVTKKIRMKSQVYKIEDEKWKTTMGMEQIK